VKTSSREFQILHFVVRFDGRTRAQIEAETGPGTAQILTQLKDQGLLRKNGSRSATWHPTPAGFALWDQLCPEPQPINRPAVTHDR
jgi:chromosome segregation and condensation protein ScpB